MSKSGLAQARAETLGRREMGIRLKSIADHAGRRLAKRLAAELGINLPADPVAARIEIEGPERPLKPPRAEELLWTATGANAQQVGVAEYILWGAGMRSVAPHETLAGNGTTSWHHVLALIVGKRIQENLLPEAERIAAAEGGWWDKQRQLRGLAMLEASLIVGRIESELGVVISKLDACMRGEMESIDKQDMEDA